MPVFPPASVPGFIPTSTGELQDLRDTWDAVLDQTCKISRVARTPDGTGGTTDTYTVDATISKMLVEAVSTHEDQIIGARFGTGQIEYIGRFSGYQNPVPAEGDRLVQCSDGHTYEVITIIDVAPSYSVNDSFGLRRLS